MVALHELDHGSTPWRILKIGERPVRLHRVRRVGDGESDVSASCKVSLCCGVPKEANISSTDISFSYFPLSYRST